MIDTHSHIYASQFDEDRDLVIERARQAGITKIVLANTDRESLDQIKQLYQTDTDLFVPTIGLHPTDVKSSFREDLAWLESHIDDIPFMAIGEIGLDLYWDKTMLEEQIEALKIQFRWASERNLPVIIHVRDAFSQIHQVLEESKHLNLRGIIHSFSGTFEDAQKISQCGNFMFGINGTVTYKKSHLPEEIKKIGLERLVIETDAPYLTPVPFRGQRNEPARVVHTAEKLAEIFECDLEEVEKITDRNALQLLFHVN